MFATFERAADELPEIIESEAKIIRLICKLFREGRHRPVLPDSLSACGSFVKSWTMPIKEKGQMLMRLVLLIIACTGMLLIDFDKQ